MASDDELTMKQVCTIQIVFPVDDDNEAIELKQKIESALKDNPTARIDFRITKMPTRPKPA